MPEYLAPAVYVEEVDTGSKPIEGVSTSTAGLVGVTERGPVDVPILITSYGDFRRWFGDALPAAEFGAHSFLPHGVEGFFANGGKRVYITRVIDAAMATRSRFMLYHDGVTTPGDTVLLRAGAELSGTAGNPPPLVALSGNNLATGDRVRIGDGSTAEYRQLQAMTAENVVVPLHLPLARAHDAGATIRQFALPAAVVATSDLAADIQTGATSIRIEDTTANINTLVASFATQFLRLNPANGEYRFIRAVTDVADAAAAGRRTARIVLDAGVALPLAAGPGLVERFDLPAPPPAAATLAPASAGGASIVFVGDRLGAFNNRLDLVVIDEADQDRREIRRIGELRTVTLGSGAVAGAPAGSVVSEAALTPNATVQVVAAPAGQPAPTTTRFYVGDVRHIAIGQRVLVGATSTPRTISAMSAGIASAGAITLDAALAATPPAGTTIVAVRRLQARARRGTPFLALDNRLGLAAGDVLRLTSGAEEEYVSIAGLPMPAAAGVKPDAGNVVLAQPLARDYDNATTEIVQLSAAGAGALQSTVLPLDVAPGSDRVLLADGSGYAASRFIALRTPDGATSFHRITGLSAIAAPMLLTLDEVLHADQPAGAPVVERLPLLEVEALDPGNWGDRLRVSVEAEAAGLANTDFLVTVVSPNQVRVGSMNGMEPGTLLQLRSPDGANVGGLLKVRDIDRVARVVSLEAPGLDAAQQAAIAALPPGQRLRVVSREFRLRVELLRRHDDLVPSRDTTVVQQEDFRSLSMDPRHSRYAPRVIGTIGGPLRRADRRPEGESWLVRVRDASTDPNVLQSIRTGPEMLVDILRDGRRRPARHALAGGTDALATLGDDHYIGQDDPNPELRTGLQSLTTLEDISIIGAPGHTGPLVQNALVNQCERMRYRFAVLDGLPPPTDSMADIQAQRAQFDTKYAALYHPWLMVPQPFPTAPGVVPDHPIPPSGHMIGIYARTDIERGVHKAPANEVVRGVTGLQRVLNKEQHDILNPYPVNINVIRDFRTNNRGIRVYGGRCITSDSDWKYVNVRRLLIFIEASIDRGLQWVVFEPNAEPLWARVRRSIANFLTQVWRNGGLEGTKVDEAFFVKCDRTTMTQTDIDQGRLICLVGVAPVKPAEFVIVRIGLWTAHAED